MKAPASLETELKISQIQQQYTQQSPQNILRLIFSKFKQLPIFFSGAEDVVLIDMATKITNNVQVFVVDTGRLPPETYEFIERVRKHYNLKIEMLLPNTQKVAELVNTKGLFSFYEDGHQECCAVRKVQPLRRQLTNMHVWITGQRQDQNPSTRKELPIIELDRTFSTKENTLIKFNPLANWSSDLVWKYIRYHQVTYNELHDRGFTSIGCQPCTKAITPNQAERAGRWWWERDKLKESGIHGENLIRAQQKSHKADH